MTFSYPLLLLSWIFLIPVVISFVHRGKRPVGLVVVAGINLFFTAYEAYMTFVWSKKVVAPIRIDIFGVIVILVVINTLTALFILFSETDSAKVLSKRIEKAMGLLLVGITLNAVIGLLQVFREGHKASQTSQAQRQQEFQTMFQDAITIKRYFGELGFDPQGWAGHYAAEPNAHGWLTRLLINTDGKVWLFFNCEPKTECIYVRGEDTVLQHQSHAITIRGLKPDVGIWTASLDLVKQGESRLLVSLIMDGAPSPNAKAWQPTMTHLTFLRTPPPTFSNSVPTNNQVQYLGIFSNGYLQRDALFVVQMWLWRSDKQIFGQYLRRGWQLGTKADFISAEAIKGTYDPASGLIAFKVSDQESFEGHLAGDTMLAGQVLWFGRPLETIQFRKKELIPGFPYDLAPLTDLKTTQEWLRVSSFGKMVSWQVPKSFDPSTW